MKNIIMLILMALPILGLAQMNEKKNESYYKITTKKCIPKKGYHLMLKQIILDSRCPEDVNCVWAGEIQVKLSLYQNQKFIVDKIITLSTKQNQEDIDWINQYLPLKYGDFNRITAYPNPKKDIKINPKKYYLKLVAK